MVTINVRMCDPCIIKMIDAGFDCRPAHGKDYGNNPSFRARCVRCDEYNKIRLVKMDVTPPS